MYGGLLLLLAAELWTRAQGVYGLAEGLRRIEGGEKVWLLTTAGEEAKERVERVAGEARLTAKEKEVLSLMLRRYTNAEISSEL